MSSLLSSGIDPAGVAVAVAVVAVAVAVVAVAIAVVVVVAVVAVWCGSDVNVLYNLGCPQRG